MSKATGNKSTASNIRPRDAKGKFTAKEKSPFDRVREYSEKHPYLLPIVQAAFIFGFREARSFYVGEEVDTDELTETFLEWFRVLPMHEEDLDEGAFVFDALYDRAYYGNGLRAVEACQRLAKSDEEREMLEALSFIAINADDAHREIEAEIEEG